MGKRRHLGYFTDNYDTVSQEELPGEKRKLTEVSKPDTLKPQDCPTKRNLWPMRLDPRFFAQGLKEKRFHPQTSSPNEEGV